MEERRRSVRHRVLQQTQIVIHDGRSVISGLVRNLSDTGARIDVDSTIGVPLEFRLRIGSARDLRPCVVKWMAMKNLGVEFA